VKQVRQSNVGGPGTRGQPHAGSWLRERHEPGGQGHPSRAAHLLKLRPGSPYLAEANSSWVCMDGKGRPASHGRTSQLSLRLRATFRLARATASAPSNGQRTSPLKLTTGGSRGEVRPQAPLMEFMVNPFSREARLFSSKRPRDFLNLLKQDGLALLEANPHGPWKALNPLGDRELGPCYPRARSWGGFRWPCRRGPTKPLHQPESGADPRKGKIFHQFGHVLRPGMKDDRQGSRYLRFLRRTRSGADGEKRETTIPKHSDRNRIGKADELLRYWHNPGWMRCSGHRQGGPLL